ncbi:hypothetical protein Tco_1565839, partial [Tanacetum coccineum]
RQDETVGVEARTSILDSDYDSEFDDDSEYDSDKLVDYLSPGEEELIELRNKIKANREAKAKAKAFGKNLEEKHVVETAPEFLLLMPSGSTSDGVTTHCVDVTIANKEKPIEGSAC